MGRELSRTERLVDAESEQLTVRVPEAIHRRVERLCELAYAAGEREKPSKKQMVAALLLAAVEGGDDLRKRLHEYGEATNADAVPWEFETERDVITMPARKPGPRSRRG